MAQAWKKMPVTVSTSGAMMGTKGLKERSWSRWISASVKADANLRARTVNGCDEVTFSTEVSEVLLPQRYYDEMAGKELKSNLVDTARGEEVGHIKSHKVYQKVPVSQSWAEIGKGPIGTRWIDINKGDERVPDYRSRFVAQ